MPGHRVRRALSGTKHSGAAILISAYTQLAHKMGQGFAALDAVFSHYRTGNSTDGFHKGYVASVYAHAPGARSPSGRNSDRTSELRQ
jgi:hypothetical protein